MARLRFSPLPAWRVSVAALALSAAVALVGGSGILSWAATTVTPTADNHAAALVEFQKARDLWEQQDYRAAKAENEKALQLDPTLTDALLLRTMLQSKLSGTATPAGAGGTGGTTTAPAAGGKLLTLQQISMIRLQELSNTEPNVRGRVPRKTLDAYWNQYQKAQAGADLSLAAYNDFINPLNFPQQVQLIRQANMPALSQTVEISSDPVNMIPFRNSVHTWVMQNCATSVCHGGEKASRFRLFRPQGGASNDATIYTNFYILTTYAPADGGKLIDRANVEKSELLQYALPKVTAIHAHPGTMDVHRFGDSNNPEFQNIAAWISGLALPEPPYGIVYEIPGKQAPATAPAPAPTKPTTSRVPPKAR